MSVEIEIRRAADRFVTRTDGIESRHTFSFGSHYDPRHVGVGALVALNDETVQPGQGFAAHPHRDIEIVTWVVSGALRHLDSTGVGGLLTPGIAQLLSAGSGVEHSEVNADPADGAASSAEPVRFIQMWVTASEQGGEPSFVQHRLDEGALAHDWVVVASGAQPRRSSSPVRLSEPGLTLSASRLTTGQGRLLPDAALLLAFVVRGQVALGSDHVLAEGDSACLRDAGGSEISARTDAEVLVWELGA